MKVLPFRYPKIICALALALAFASSTSAQLHSRSPGKLVDLVGHRLYLYCTAKAPQPLPRRMDSATFLSTGCSFNRRFYSRLHV
jgi:hypothetical protein